MSENTVNRPPTVAVGLLLFAVTAMAITSLAIHPPRAMRMARAECQVSGKVASQGRPVTRGTICFSCVMLADAAGIESFPDVTVRIVEGAYVIAAEDGLVPGRYDVTIRAQELGPEATDFASEDGHRVHHAGHDLILVAEGAPSSVDFEL